MRTEILYEDNSILVIRKPAGLAVQSARIGQADVVSELKSYLAKQAGAGQGEPYLAVIHRLDQPVEGVLVFAKEKKSAAVLTKQLSAGTLNKQYYAVLCGYPDASEGELVDYLRKEGSVAVAVTGREMNFPDAKIAKLHYSILEKINQPMPLALADVCIETGRFHQIRVQFAHAGWALLGDTKYGNTTVAGTAGSPAYRGVALCAYSLDFTHPGNGKKMSFRVKPQNPAFEKFLRRIFSKDKKACPAHTNPKKEVCGMDWGEFGKKIIGKKMIVLLLVTGAVYFFLQYLTPLSAPVLLAMLFVTIFGPMMKRMNQRLHFPRPLSAIVLLIVATVLLVGLLWILVSWMLGSLPVWIGNLELREQEWLEAVRGLCRSVGEIIGVETAYLENTVSGRLQEGLDSLEENILPGMLSQSMQYVQWFAELGGFLVTFLIASVLLAKDYDGIMNRLLDQEACHVLLEVICGIVRYIATFVKAQGIIMTTIAMTAAATLGIAGIKHGILWGILAGILDALPFIGTGVVLVPLGMFQILDGNWGRALVCGVLYVVCIFLREVMEPRLIGRKIGVSPIAVLVSLYAGIRLFGVWGIIKGPLGFVLIYETYHSLARMYDRQREQEQQE